MHTSAQVRALPGAAFTSLGALLKARRAAQATAPIQLETRCRGSFGVDVVATGSADQLVGGGICTADHLPAARKRQRFGTAAAGPVRWWESHRLPGGRFKVVATLRADTEEERRAGYGIQSAQRRLAEELAADPVADARQRLLASLDFVRIGCDRGALTARGTRLGEAAEARLRSILDEIAALTSRAEAIARSAEIHIDPAEREAYLQTLREKASITMPPLPPPCTEQGK